MVAFCGLCNVRHIEGGSLTPPARPPLPPVFAAAPTVRHTATWRLSVQAEWKRRTIYQVLTDRFALADGASDTCGSGGCPCTIPRAAAPAHSPPPPRVPSVALQSPALGSPWCAGGEAVRLTIH